MSSNVTLSSSSCPPDEWAPLLKSLSFWGEGVLALLICVTGLVANAAAIPVLLSKKMASTFNRLLVFLTVFDSLFLLCVVSESVRKHLYSSPFQLALLVNFVYQLQNVALLCSTLTTVVLAVERYLAVTKPVEYHIMTSSQAANPWLRVWKYMLPTIAFSLLFNLPKFFELELHDTSEVEEALDPLTNETFSVNVTTTRMLPTDLRLNELYAFFYVNVASLLVTGIVPFVGLLFLNWRINRYVN